MCAMRQMRCFASPHGFVYILRHASRLSKMPHFWGLHTPTGATTPKFKLGQDFCTMHLPQVSSSYVYSLANYRLDKQTHNPQTNRFRQKHPTFFATLRRWVKRHSKLNILLYTTYGGITKQHKTHDNEQGGWSLTQSRPVCLDSWAPHQSWPGDEQCRHDPCTQPSARRDDPSCQKCWLLHLSLVIAAWSSHTNKSVHAMRNKHHIHSMISLNYIAQCSLRSAKVTH